MIRRHGALVALACAAGMALGACGGGGGGSVASFCALAKADQAKFAGSSSATDLPAELSAFDSLVGKAPSDIKGDVVIVRDVVKKIVSKSPDALTAAGDKKFTAASTNVQKYMKDKCGVDTTTGT